MRRSNATAFILASLFAGAIATAPAEAVCLATGRVCLSNGDYDDSLCCPGMVCGWGGVCQAGCRVDAQFYRQYFRNPDNPCEQCNPRKSTTAWTNTCPALDSFGDTFADLVVPACMVDQAAASHDPAEFGARSSCPTP